MKPNLIERLENLIAALDEASEEANNEFPASVLTTNIDNALGIAGEILTMIDGR